MKLWLTILVLLLAGCGIKSERIRALTCIGFCTSAEVDLTMEKPAKEP